MSGIKNEKIIIAMCLTSLTTAGYGEQSDVAKFDPNMIVKNAIVDDSGVKWIDGQYLPLEGKAFSDVDFFYDRLPKNVTTNVNPGVRNIKHHSAGLQFRFKTDSGKLWIKWTPRNRELAMDHMPSTGVSGIDIYAKGDDGVWRYVKTGRITNPDGGVCELGWKPGTPCLINLPLYNGIKTFTLGIEANATVEALEPRTNGINRPVVFYGTSITQGGCCSRPGLSFVNIVGRQLDVPVVNLGFSGSGKMELEMSEHLTNIDAACYVLDCLWNMDNPTVEKNYEPFIRNLRSKCPNVPIVMAEQCDVFSPESNYKDKVMRNLYEKLLAEGWKDLVYLPKTKMYLDSEGTVDGCHPNDRGMMSLAVAFGEAVKIALDL